MIVSVSASAYWEKVWVDGHYDEVPVWVDGHYDEIPVWIDGYYDEVPVWIDGYWDVDYQWVAGHYETDYQWVEGYYEAFLVQEWITIEIWQDGYWDGDTWVDGWYVYYEEYHEYLEYVWVDGHYDEVSVWVDGYYEEIPVWIEGYWDVDYQWVEGHYETDYQWVDGYWDIDYQWVDGHFEYYWVDDEDEQPDPDEGTDEPIDTKTGNNYFTEERLYVPCLGIPLEFNLKYQSVTTQPKGFLGKDWLHSYEWYLDVQEDRAVLYTGSGNKFVFVENEDETYRSPASNSWKLSVDSAGYTVQVPGGLVYRFISGGWLTRIENKWGTWVECVYDTNSCLSTVNHSNGRQIIFSNRWDSALEDWRIGSISVPNGYSLSFFYNSAGQFTQLVEYVDAACYTSRYQYADGYLTNKVNGVGHQYSFSYEIDTNGLFSGKGTYLAADGYYEHSVGYTSSNITDVIYSTRGIEQTFRYVYTNAGELAFKYGPATGVAGVQERGTRFAYASNRVDKTEETLFDNSAGATSSQWMQYDDAHNVTNIAVAYNSTIPVHQASMQYDPVWNLPSIITDAESDRVEMVYTNGLPLTVKAFYSDTQSYDTHYSYNTNGWLAAITNANGHATGYTYDNSGNLITAAAQLGPVVSNRYNSLGFTTNAEVISASGASSGRITQFTRDAKGRVTGITHADGLTSSNSYNALDYLMNTIDRAGRVTEYTYAPTKKLTSVTQYLEQDGSNIPVRISYDLDQQMNLLRITEPRGRYVESYKLDIQDRIAAVTNIEGQTMTIDYGVGDFVKRMVRFDGSVVSNAYDAAGRPSTTVYLSPSNTLLSTVSRTYYADSKLKTVSDGVTVISNSYDRLNRLSGTLTSIGSLQSAIANAYDPVGNLTNSTVDLGGSRSVATAYQYDQAERLTSISSGLSTFDLQSFDYSYNSDNGQVFSVSNQNLRAEYQYDIMDRITSIDWKNAWGATILAFDYQYNAVGMITNRILTRGASSVATAYKYDTINRLVSETENRQSEIVNRQYSYDLAGNRLAKTGGDFTVNYALGEGDRLASWSAASTNNFLSKRTLRVEGSSSEAIGTDNRWGQLYVSNTVAVTPETGGTNFWVNSFVTGLGTQKVVAAIRDQAGNTGYATNEIFLSIVTNAQYGYNAAGCLTNMVYSGTEYSESKALEWNVQYQLTSVSSACSAVNYSYDVTGRRISRAEGTNVEQYVYTGEQVVADLDASGNMLRTYVWGPGIDNLLALTTYGAETNTYYVVKDHLNTVHALVDENGTIVERYEYDAWGRTTVFSASGDELTESAVGNRYCFQGREIDWTTGLYYFRARWYDSVAGHWLSKDPIGIGGGLNLYAFCGNNSVNFVDPRGLNVVHLVDTDDALGGMGHAAAAVGNDDSHGWIYYSFSGGEDLFSSSAPSDNLEVRWYRTLSELMADNTRYENSHQYTTSAAEDLAANLTAFSWDGVRFGPFTQNCDDMVTAVMRAAGIDVAHGKTPMATFRNQKQKCNE